MIINELIKQKSITKYRLAKTSNVPHTTILDICNGKTKIEKCSVDTLYKIAKALDVSIETLIEEKMEHRSNFEIYKSNICHLVKDMGDIDFIIETLEANKIRTLYQKQWFPECFYLLAMVDYLSRENDLPICSDYNDIRALRLKETLYPVGILTMCAAFQNNEPKRESLQEAIPEFLHFNIVESEVRNVC